MPIDPIRKKRLSVPLSVEELEKIKGVADNLGVPVSGLIRLIIRKIEDCIGFLKESSKENGSPQKKRGKGPSEG